MIVLANSIRIKTNFKLQFLFGLQSTFSLLYLKNSFFFDLIILQMPIYIFLIDITD